MLDFELQILEHIQQNRIEQLDSILIFFTSTTTVVSISLAILFSWLIFKEQSVNKSKLYSFGVFLTLSISSLVSYILKLSIARPRPFTETDHIVELSKIVTHSFPSGHTTAVFAIVFGLAFFYPKLKFLAPVIIWAFIVAYSRLALGVHYVSDVLAGVFLSFLIAVLLNLWLKANRSNKASLNKDS